MHASNSSRRASTSSTASATNFTTRPAQAAAPPTSSPSAYQGDGGRCFLDYPQRTILRRIETFMRDYYRHTRNIHNRTSTRSSRSSRSRSEDSSLQGGLHRPLQPRARKTRKPSPDSLPPAKAASPSEGSDHLRRGDRAALMQASSRPLPATEHLTPRPRRCASSSRTNWNLHRPAPSATTRRSASSSSTALQRQG